MTDPHNLQLDELDNEQSSNGEARPQNAKDLEAVYDIPVQISAVLGRATMQVSQLLKLGRGAVVAWRAARSSSSTSAWASP
jgi:flagellar motor switch protein FliN